MAKGSGEMRLEEAAITGKTELSNHYFFWGGLCVSQTPTYIHTEPLGFLAFHDPIRPTAAAAVAACHAAGIRLIMARRQKTLTHKIPSAPTVYMTPKLLPPSPQKHPLTHHRSPATTRSLPGPSRAPQGLSDPWRPSPPSRPRTGRCIRTNRYDNGGGDGWYMCCIFLPLFFPSAHRRHHHI